MNDKDYIKELFSEKLANLEAPVRPDLWSGIASQIGATAPVVSTGMSLLAKVSIGISIAASVAVGAYLLVDKAPDSDNKVDQKQISSETKNTEETIPSQEVPLKVTPIKSIEKNLIPLQEENSIVEEELNKESPVFEEFVAPVAKENKIVEEKLAPKVLPKPNEIPKQVIQPIIEENGSTGEIVEQEIAVDELFLPNIFSPNGDGTHDYLQIDLTGYTDVSVVIIDERNKIVFQTSQPDFMWDGGDLPTSDVIYYITCRNPQGKLITRYNRLRIQR